MLSLCKNAFLFARFKENLYKIELMKIAALIILSIAFFFAGCRPAAAPVAVSDQPVSINNVPQTNVPLPLTKNIDKLGWEFSGNGRQTLGELKGKVVVLDFWATYCPPCLEEIPHLVEMQNRYGSEKFQIIGLHAGGEEDAPKVPAFVEKLKINYPVATPDTDLADMLFGGDSAIPQTFVFDAKGKLIKKFIGYDLKVKNDLEKTVEKALNQ